jgi:hypothetical protein
LFIATRSKKNQHLKGMTNFFVNTTCKFMMDISLRNILRQLRSVSPMTDWLSYIQYVSNDVGFYGYVLVAYLQFFVP